MAKTNNKTVIGVCTCKAESVKSSKNNVEWTRIVVRTNDSNLVCLFLYRELAYWAVSQLDVGTKVTAMGSWKEGILHVNHIETIEESKTSGQVLLDYYGSTAKVREARAEHDKYYKKHGLVKVMIDGRPRFINSKYAVCVDGEWYSRIEYLCDKLGDEQVSKRLKDFFPKLDFRKIQIGGTSMKEYHDFIQNMIDEVEFA